MFKTTILKKIIGTLLAALLTTGTGVGVTSAINNENLNKAKDTLNSIISEVSINDVKEAENELTSEISAGSTQIFDSISRQATSSAPTNTVVNNEPVNNTAQESNVATQKSNNAVQKSNGTVQKTDSSNTVAKSNEKVSTSNNTVSVNTTPSTTNTTPADTSSADNSAKAVESKSAKSPVRSTSGTMNTSLARQAFDLINNYRVSNGLSALSWSDSDAAVATVRAKEIASDFSHTSASGTKTNGGENIAVTYGGTADEVVNGWINSSGHRANILRESAVSAGLAVYVINGQYFWSNNFTKSNEVPKANAENTTTTWKNVNGKEVQVITDNDGNICVDGGAIKRDAEGWADGHFEIREISDEDVFGDGSLVSKTATVDAVTDTGIQICRFWITAGEKGITVLGNNNLKITWDDINNNRAFQVKGRWTEVRWK